MALTFTIAGLRTQLDAVATAVDSADFVAARNALVKARLVDAGLPEGVSADGARVQLRAKLDKLEQLIEAAEAATASTDRRRFIKTTQTYGSG